MPPPVPFAVPTTAKIVFVIMFIGTSAIMVLGLMPILLGGLAGAGRLNDVQIGWAGMLEIIGMATGAAIGPRLVNRGHMPVTVAVACVLLAIVNLFMFLASSPIMILGLRALAGMLQGIMLSSIFLLITHSRRPSQLNAYLLGISTLPQILLAYLLPVLLVPRFGTDVGFAVIALFALTSSFVAYFLLPARVATPSHYEMESEGGRLRLSPTLLMVLAASFLQNAGIGAAWNYVERLGNQHGLSAEIIGMAIAGCLACQVAGSFLTAWFGDRVHAGFTLIAGACAQACIVAGLVAFDTAPAFIMACCAFGFVWLALQPFQLSWVIALDPSRRSAPLLPALSFTGIGIGPLLVSFLVSGSDIGPTFVGAGALLALSFMLYVATLVSSRANPSVMSTAIEIS